LKIAWKASDLSTGTPGGCGQNRACHLTGQLPGRAFNAAPRLDRLGVDVALGLADLLAGGLAGGVQRCLALGVPLLQASLARLEDFGTRLAKPGSLSVACNGFCTRNS